MGERAGDLPPTPRERPQDEALVLYPAMDSTEPAEWPGARWIGTIDLRALAGHTHLRLQNSEGYRRAWLLVREDGSLRGFVDVDAVDGVVDRRTLEISAASLPAALPRSVMRDTPWITVVVCTRDRSDQLRGSLAAILRLDYPGFDVLVVDNAARTSETRDMVHQEFQDSRMTLVSEPVPGLAQARNTGLSHARGDIVAFTDDDVIVDRDWLREIAAAFQRVPAAACVTGLVPAGEMRSPVQRYFDDRVSWSKSLVPRVYSLAEPPENLPRFPFCVGEYGTGANFALDRRAALALGGFDTALGVGTRTGGGEDIDMFTRVVLSGRSLVMQPSAIVWHRHRGDIDELRLQARSYGTGLGAWLTKILLNPRTAWMALARSPYAVRHFVSNARRKPGRVPEGQAPVSADWDRQLAKVLRLELISVARGPFNYLLQRSMGKSVGT